MPGLHEDCGLQWDWCDCALCVSVRLCFGLPGLIRSFEFYCWSSGIRVSGGSESCCGFESVLVLYTVLEPRPGSICSGPHVLQLRYDFVIAPELHDDCGLRWDRWDCDDCASCVSVVFWIGGGVNCAV